MSFGLAQFSIADVTRRLELPEISSDPKKPLTLIVRHAGDGNRSWVNVVFKMRGDELPIEPGIERADALRAQSVAIISACAVAGWENVIEGGHPASFSLEAITRFLGEMANECPDVWARVLNYVGNVRNFRAAVVDRVDLGKG